jgi:phosphate transport system permease protein
VVPFDLSAGIYVAEFRDSRRAKTIRFLADALVGLPSIVLGYFGYATMVEGLGWQFSVAAASITLAIISLPYVSRAPWGNCRRNCARRRMQWVPAPGR